MLPVGEYFPIRRNCIAVKIFYRVVMAIWLILKFYLIIPQTQ